MSTRPWASWPSATRREPRCPYPNPWDEPEHRCPCCDTELEVEGAGFAPDSGHWKCPECGWVGALEDA